MDRFNASVHVTHTSSCSADDIGIIEGHMTANSDVTFTLDFPLVRGSYVNTPLSTLNSSITRRDLKGGDSNGSCSVIPLQNYGQIMPSSGTLERSLSGTGSLLANSASSKVTEACWKFSDITTFHGMRFVCARKVHLIRRSIWLMLVLACLGVLLLQVYQQVVYYNSNPKSVNVEKKHQPYVEFPSLTICNENAFKISAAADNNLYRVINAMMSGTLTIELLKEVNQTDLRLDELNYILGNHIDTMLLRCKWSKDEKCGVENFTAILADQGLCFTFNSPDAVRSLTVQGPGLSKGLQLALNIEEYERMAGPHVASGIHVLVHMKRQYPMVEQLGQAVAAGSHSFIALSLKKEHRLGEPYDTCKDGILTFVPNVTYDYDLPACQIDCYVKYVVEKCGCRDYFMPGNAEVCTLSRYVTCLRGAQKEYQAISQEYCSCTIPCNLEYADPSYSYASLSSSAIDKVKEEDKDDILARYKNALDVHEYLSARTQGKKETYKNFSETLQTVRQLYSENMTSVLKEVRAQIQKLKGTMQEVYQIKDDYLWAQTYVVRKNFIEAKDEMDERTLGELADDIHVFSESILNKIQKLGNTSDPVVRGIFYDLLVEQVSGRLLVANLSLENFTQLVYAYENGQPIFNYSLPTDDRVFLALLDAQNIIPVKLLREALTHSEDGKIIGLAAAVHIKNITTLMQELLEMAEEIHISGNLTEQQMLIIHEIIDKFKEACMSYLKSRENLYEEIIEWPEEELRNKRQDFENKEDKCLDEFDDMLVEMASLDGIAWQMVNNTLSVFQDIDTMLLAYLTTWNINKFDIADKLLSPESENATADLKSLHDSLSNHIQAIRNLWTKLDTCAKEILLDDFGDDRVIKFIELVNEDLAQAVYAAYMTENLTADIRQEYQSILYVESMHLELEKLIDSMVEEFKTFRDKAVLDTAFYSENFIFLDIFFTDISHTITEHQIAYDIFKLLSDIGGSMGLLVGASAISLFEFVDLFCVLSTILCSMGRRSGERPSPARSTAESSVNSRF